MGRIRTAGLIKRGDIWHIDKSIGGKRLCESTGETALEQAESYLALATVRRILNLAASEWMDEYGLTWLDRPPKITLLKVTDARKPYPISWEEQTLLFRELPDHLAPMALCKVNTGCGEQEVCSLQWDWEVEVPELDTSVFIIPDTLVKNGEERLVVLNRTAMSIVNEVRGKHRKHVFT